MANVPCRFRLAELLLDVEQHLRDAGLWQSEPPAEGYLTSEQPFALDHLSLVQWLQFVFIPRLQGLLASGESLPDSCAIAPMAEEYCRQMGIQAASLVASLRLIDGAISGTQEL